MCLPIILSLTACAGEAAHTALPTLKMMPTSTIPPTLTPTPTPTQIPTLSLIDREVEEYAVYRVILSLEGERCIHDQTLTLTNRFSPGPPELDPGTLRELDYELRKDYNQSNLESVPLDPDLLGGSVTLLSGYDDWPCFFIQGFSRVGFNKHMDEALVYHESIAPPMALAGGGRLIYLVKGEDGIWKVK